MGTHPLRLYIFLGGVTALGAVTSDSHAGLGKWYVYSNFQQLLLKKQTQQGSLHERDQQKGYYDFYRVWEVLNWWRCKNTFQRVSQAVLTPEITKIVITIYDTSHTHTHTRITVLVSICSRGQELLLTNIITTTSMF